MRRLPILLAFLPNVKPECGPIDTSESKLVLNAEKNPFVRVRNIKAGGQTHSAFKEERDRGGVNCSLCNSESPSTLYIENAGIIAFDDRLDASVEEMFDLEIYAVSDHLSISENGTCVTKNGDANPPDGACTHDQSALSESYPGFLGPVPGRPSGSNSTVANTADEISDFIYFRHKVPGSSTDLGTDGSRGLTINGVSGNSGPKPTCTSHFKTNYGQAPTIVDEDGLIVVDNEDQDGVLQGISDMRQCCDTCHESQGISDGCQQESGTGRLFRPLGCGKRNSEGPDSSSNKWCATGKMSKQNSAQNLGSEKDQCEDDARWCFKPRILDPGTQCINEVFFEEYRVRLYRSAGQGASSCAGVDASTGLPSSGCVPFSPQKLKISFYDISIFNRISFTT